MVAPPRRVARARGQPSHPEQHHIEPASNQTFTVSPTTTTTANVGTTGQANVSYTVTGLNNAATYDLALFSCANVDTSTAAVKFLHSSNPGGTGNIALQGTISNNTTISVLNGAAVQNMGNTVNINDVSPSAGQITFTINSGNAGECIVPVLYGTADGNNDLNLGTNNQPTDSFGVGGAANFVNLAMAGVFGSYNANGGQAPSDGVTAHSGMTFTANNGWGDLTYTYKTTDSFFTWNATTGKYVASTEAAFAAALSVGDTVAGIYQPTGTSTFVLWDQAPAAPGNLTAATPSGVNAGKAGIQLAFTKSDSFATVGSYNVYRATAIQPTMTGQVPTCPTASSAFAKLGSVTATDALNTVGTYTFLDGTATVPPTATPTNPEYCYKVTAVDGTSESAASAVGPFTATAATTATGAPAFATGAVVGTTTTVTVQYASTIALGTVDTDGSDYTVTYTVAGTTYADAVTGAAATAIALSGSVPAHGQVVLTVTTAIPSGAVVVVHVQKGTDTDTVSNGATTPLFQATTDAIEMIAS